MPPRGGPALPDRRPKNGRRIRKLRLLALVVVLGLLSSASFLFGLMTAIAGQLPAVRPRAPAEDRARRGYMYDRHGELLTVLRGRESRVILTSSQINPIMKQAIVAIEDKRFYDHNGVDMRAIGRAFWADIRAQGRRAGRFDDHAAVHQELLREGQPLDRAQAERGGPRVAARAAQVEGLDPHRLPQHHLLRERRLRDRAGGDDLLPRAREPSHFAAGCATRRNPA